MNPPGHGLESTDSFGTEVRRPARHNFSERGLKHARFKLGPHQQAIGHKIARPSYLASRSEAPAFTADPEPWETPGSIPSGLMRDSCGTSGRPEATVSRVGNSQGLPGLTHGVFCTTIRILFRFLARVPFGSGESTGMLPRLDSGLKSPIRGFGGAFRRARPCCRGSRIRGWRDRRRRGPPRPDRRLPARTGAREHPPC